MTNESSLVIDRPPIRNNDDLRALESVPLAQRLHGLDTTLDLFERSARNWPQRIALSYLPHGDLQDRPIDVSYVQLRDRIVQTANLFSTFDLSPDDCVVYLLPNLPETHYVIWGAQAVCRVAAINHYLEPAQILDLIKALDAKIVVTCARELSPDVWDKVSQLLPSIPALRACFVVGGTRPGTNEQAADFTAAIERQPSTPQFAVAHDAGKIAAGFHTGGTTGTPKVALLSHGALVSNSWMISEIFDTQPTDVIACGLPMFHVNAVVVTGLAAFLCGARVILAGPNGFRNPALIGNFWRLVERFQVTAFSGVPTIYAALLGVPIGDAKISSLRFGVCGAAPMPVETFRRFEQATGIKLLEGFGMTETTAGATGNPRNGERRVGSIGLPAPYTRMKVVILDNDGQYVRDAEVDEIGVVAITEPHLFSGYQNPVHNAHIWVHPGWLNTGDLGRIDADGYYWLCGRAKDVIIRGGHNIDPSITEATLVDHPDVALVAAVGKPDAYAGELPVAYVMLRPGASVTASALQEYAKAKAQERAAAPAWVELIDQMPMTAVGKIFKPALRKQATVRTLRELLEAADVPAEIDIGDDPKAGVLVTIKVGNEAHRLAAEQITSQLTVKVRTVIR